MDKKIYKIPVTWEMSGYVFISDADNLEDAIETFDNIQDIIPLPTTSHYIDGSFQRGSTEECKIENEL